MRPVFLDTVGLLASWDASDQWHGVATDALRRLAAAGHRTVTTTFVMLECGNAATRRPYRALVAQTHDALRASGRLIVPTEEDWQFAWAQYARTDTPQAGIVDQVSFIVMRRLGITDVFGNDRHFKAAGFIRSFEPEPAQS